MCAKGQMVKFSPAAWVTGTYQQTHCLQAGELKTAVAEFALFEKANGGRPIFSILLAKGLCNATFPLMSDGSGIDPVTTGALQLSRLGALSNTMGNSKAVAVAVYDHIGIAQELNDFRNDALNKVNDFLNTADKEGVTNRWKFDSLQAIRDVKAGLEKGLASEMLLKEMHIRARYEPNFPDDPPEMRKFKLGWSNYQRDHDRTTWPQRFPQKSAELETKLAKQRADEPKQIANKKGEAKQRWARAYAPLLDDKAMTNFDTDFDAAVKVATDLAVTRVDDHLKWVLHDRFVDAFDIYDRKSFVAGNFFEAQSALCTLGMTGIEKSAEQIDAWLKMPITERKNIYMRGLLLNHDDIEKEAVKALAAAGAIAAAAPAVAAIDGKLMYKALKGMIDFYKNADSAWDEYVRNPGQADGHSKTYVGKKLFKYSEVTRSIFRGKISKLEMDLVGRMSGLVFARLGGVAHVLAYQELMYGIDPQSPHPHTPLNPAKPERNSLNKPTTSVNVPPRENMNPAHAVSAGKQSAQKIDPALRALMTDAEAQHQARLQGITHTVEEYLENNRTNNYHQVRIGALLGVMETIALGCRLWEMANGKEKVSGIQVLEATANVMSLVSIGYNTAYVLSKSVREHSRDTVIRGSADIVRGGYKMWAGAFGAVAGGLGVWADYIRLGKEEAGSNRDFMKTLIWARMVIGVGNTIAVGAAAFSYSGPMLRRIEINLAESALKRRAVIGGAAKAAEWLAKRVLLLRLVAWGSGAGLVLIGVEILYNIYLFILPSELEIWCKRSAFRNRQLGGNPYSSAEQEMVEQAKARKLPQT